MPPSMSSSQGMSSSLDLHRASSEGTNCRREWKWEQVSSLSEPRTEMEYGFLRNLVLPIVSFKLEFWCKKSWFLLLFENGVVFVLTHSNCICVQDILVYSFSAKRTRNKFLLSSSGNGCHHPREEIDCGRWCRTKDWIQGKYIVSF